MAYNTGNPLGSTDPRDAADNKENFDRFAVSTERTYTDRLGVDRKTITGTLQDYAAYNPRGDWSTATAYNTNDIWRDPATGDFYFVPADYTSGASVAADIAAGNVVPHQIKNTVFAIDTIADLRALEPLFDGQQIELLGHTVAGIGGDPFYADFSDTITPDDNGVTIVTAGGRRWKRKLEGFVTADMFGAIDTVSTDTTALLAAVSYCSSSNIDLLLVRVYNTNAVLSVTNTTGFKIFGPGGITTTGTDVIHLTSTSCRNVIIDGVTLNKNSTTFGFAAQVINGADSNTIKNCKILSKHGLVIIGSSSGTTTPTETKILDNFMLSTGNEARGLRCRTSTDNNRLPGVLISGNTIMVDNPVDGDVGIECWIGGAIITDNNVTAVGRNGGASGIVCGVSPRINVSTNFVYGWERGIEVGGTGAGAHTITGNIMSACQGGLTVSTGGVEKSIVVDGNVVIFDDSDRWQGQDRSGNKAFGNAYKSQAQNTIFSNNIAIFLSEHGYTSTKSREGTAFAGNTNNNQMSVIGNYAEGFELGVDMAATGGEILTDGNVFNNVAHPIQDSGGDPRHSVTNNLVNNFYSFRINHTARFVGNIFRRSPDFVFPRSGLLPANCVYAEVDASESDTVITNIANTFENCLDTCLAADTSFPQPASGFGRPVVEDRGDVLRTRNHATWSAVKTALTGTSVGVPYNRTIETWFTDLAFIKRYSAKNTDITDGNDTIENWG